MERRPVVYILASPNKRALYIGVTTDLGRRLEEHRLGLSVHTARYNIDRLVYIESHETAPDAIEREKHWIWRARFCKQRLIVEARSLRSALRASVETTGG
jgi:putative endonuclease